jgi:SAM-dependent methyltransferase
MLAYVTKSIKHLENDAGQFILPIKVLQHLPQNKRYKLLDVGAAGHYIQQFLPDNIEYWSLDHNGKQDYIHNLDNFPLPVESNKFDIILCLETLEHLLYPHKVMEELLRISKPNALFLLSMPNEYNFYCRLNFLLGKKTDMQEPFRVIEKHWHIQLPRVEDILQLFSEHIQIEKIDFQWYSRKSTHSKGLKTKIASVLDNAINLFAKAIPTLFARTVVVCGKRRQYSNRYKESLKY